MAHDVIVSYASGDKPIADAVCALLEGRAIRCWIAPRDVIPGSEYAGSIIRAIESSRIMVLIFSGESNASKQVLREVERAVGRDKIIVPFRVESVEPSDSLEYFLSVPHWLDALTPPLEAHIERLARAVAALLLEQAPATVGRQHSAERSDLARRLAAMLWDGERWRCRPLDVFKVQSERQGIEITNTVTTHYHARIVFQRELAADFRSELKLAGDFRDLQLVDATGGDRALWVNPSELGIDTSPPQIYRISRQSGHVAIEHAERGSLAIGCNADPSMRCLLSVALDTGKRVCIQSWVVWEELASRE